MRKQSTIVPKDAIFEHFYIGRSIEKKSHETIQDIVKFLSE